MTLGKDCPKCGTDLAPYAALPTPPAFCLQCKFPLMLIAGKYRLERVLGEGGFGTVYLARHVRLTRNAERVVKLIKPDIFQYEGMDKRFYREVQVTSDLSQRNEHIVRIYDDFGEENHLGHFYVMEYLQGLSLLDYINKPGCLPEIGWSLTIFRQLCDAMQAAHEEDIIHRDLKPENILLISRRKEPFFVKVLDFGIAKPMSAGGETKLTQGALGTPYYMSPEQTVNRPVDARSDQYSMAIMLYEMLTGSHPFIPPERENSISAMELMSAHMMQEMPDVCRVHPERNIPDGIGEIIIKATAKEPNNRFDTIDEFWDAIEECAGPLARVKASEMASLLPEKLRQTPSEKIRKAATSAFAMTAGPEELGPGLLNSSQGPRVTPRGIHQADPNAATRDGGSSPSLPNHLASRPRSHQISTGAEVPAKSRILVWGLLVGLLIGGVAVGIFAAEKFGAKKAKAPKKAITAIAPKRPVKEPARDRAIALRPTRDDVVGKRVATTIRRPSPTPAVRRPAPVRRKLVRRKPPRRRSRRRWRRRRPKPVPRRAANPNACPKAGWVRLKIRACSHGRGAIETQGSGIPGGKSRATSICVPPNTRVNIEQRRCSPCVFKLPANPTTRNIYLKNTDEVDFDTGKACLKP